jgi:uroporphyrinogen-III synthase
LFGKRVLITRTRKQASTLAKLLADEGAIPIELPAIEIEPSADPAEVAAAAARLAAGEYAWAVFTSANAVEEWFRHLAARNLDARAFGGTKVAAIGPATADALVPRGIAADLIPPEYIAESVLESMATVILSGDSARRRNTAASRRNPAAGTRGTALGNGSPALRILLPRAEDARPELPEGLRALGATVDEVILYRASTPTDPSRETLEFILRGNINIVTLTSSSSARNLAVMLHRGLEELTASTEKSGDEPPSTKVVWWEDLPLELIQLMNRGMAEADGLGPDSLQTILGNPVVACIGPITAQTAREVGLVVDVEAAEHTVEGLVRAIRELG